MTASSNIPNSISPEELARLAESAVTSDDVTDSEAPLYGGMTEEAIYELVGNSLEAISKACDHPVSHKLAAILVVNNMIEWHNRMYSIMLEDGETEAAKGWLRDAGKFQAILNIICTIEIGNDDFTMYV